MKQYYPVFRNSNFFEGIPEDKFPNILSCLNGQFRTFKRSQILLNIGEKNQLAGLVLLGTIEMTYLDENGNQINLNHLSPGQLFGADLACSHHDSLIQFRALTYCEVLFFQIDNLLADTDLHCPHRLRVTSNLLRTFARQTEFLNLRLRIICQKKLRDKLKLYLRTLPMDELGQLKLPFTRNELAEYLYADRSALSRELCRMRDDGLLCFDGNHIRLLDKTFLTM